MVVDLGTGDGRAVLARASAEPGALVIGIDANAAVMAEPSRRAARGSAGKRAGNALFLVEAAEALPGWLDETASLVTITMPWGSLLRGVVGLDMTALRGVASVVAPQGRIEVLVSVVTTDHVGGIATLDQTAEAGIAAAWRSVGFELDSMRPATLDDVRSSRSSWVRRLGDRPVWRIQLRRCDRGSVPARQRARHRSACLERSPNRLRGRGVSAAHLAPAVKMGDTSGLPIRPQRADP